MAKRLVEQYINNLGEFTSFVETYTAMNENVWFRGVGSSEYKLLPSLYRHPTLTDAQHLIKTEHDILERFKQRSIPFINRVSIGKDYWDYFFVMQHYGIPTRLLDWSENPFISLYFALASAHYDSKKSFYTKDAAVWVLKPNTWNKVSLADITHDGKIIGPDDDLMEAYSSDQKVTTPKRLNPIAIHGNHNSTRIVAQKGAFMLFGTGTDGMDVLFEKDKTFPDDSLVKLVISKSHIGGMSETLNRIGITDSVVYPDLEGLAREIKRQYNFNR